jgi:hypothetical protein
VWDAELSPDYVVLVMDWLFSSGGDYQFKLWGAWRCTSAPISTPHSILT